MNARTILTAAFMAVFALAWAAPAQADLVGYWPFDEGSGTTIHDRSGNGHDGASGGKEAWDNSGVPDAPDGWKWWFWDDDSKVITVPDDESFHITDTFTLCVRITESSTYGPACYVQSGHWGYGDGDAHWRYWKGGGQGSPMRFDGTDAPSVTFNWGPNYNDPKDHVITYDTGLAEGNMKLYLDGDLQDSVDATTPISDWDNLYFGDGVTCGAGDEVSLWNEALGAGKVGAMYDIRSVNSEALYDYTADEMETLFDVFDTGTADTVTSDVGDLTWYPYTEDAVTGDAGDVVYDGTDYYAFFDDTSGVSTVALVAGDLDGDGDVDLLDFGIFQANFTGPDGSGMTPGDGDLDGDGDVDLLDFGTFQANFTGPGGGMTVNPEPATLALVGLGGAGLLLGRKRR